MLAKVNESVGRATEVLVGALAVEVRLATTVLVGVRVGVRVGVLLTVAVAPPWVFVAVGIVPLMQLV